MAACSQCDQHSHLSCCGFVCPTTVPDEVVCYSCSKESGDQVWPFGGDKQPMSDTEAKVSSKNHCSQYIYFKCYLDLNHCFF